MGQEISQQGGSPSGNGPPVAQSSQKQDVVKTTSASPQKSEASNADWTSDMLGTLWPYVSPAIRLILEEDLIPMLPKQAAKYCRILSFDLGKCSPVLRPLRAYKAVTPSTGKNELRMDIEMDYSADVDIVLDVGVCKLGVNRVEFSGELAIIAKPLMQEIPLAGGISFFFEREPHVNILFKEAAVVAEIPIIKNTLMDAFVDLVRREIVAPHAACAVMNPDLPLELCDPVWLRGVEPVGIACVQLKQGNGLCRWTSSRPGKPLTPENVDLRVALRSFGAEWHSAVLEYCDGDPEWDTADDKATIYVLTASDQQIVTFDAYDDSRLCGPEDRHLGGAAITVNELGKGEDGWVELQASATGSLDGLEPPTPPRLQLAATWLKLGPLLEQHGDITKAVAESAKCSGALAVRIGGIEKCGIIDPLTIAVRIDGGPVFESRPSEPKAWCPTPRLRLPPREQRVVARLHGKGWSVNEIAELIERPAEVVRREIDPKLLAEQDDPDSKKDIAGAHHIMDMIWLPVRRARPNQGEGSQVLHFEARDLNGCAVASKMMTLDGALAWPPLKWLNLKMDKPTGLQVVSPRAGPKAELGVQLVLRFRPCE